MKSKISLVPSDRFVVTSIDDAVKLRTGSETPNNYDPITVPQLLNEAEADAGYVQALRVKRNGQQLTWTYRDYLRDVRNAAKAMLKAGLQESHAVCILGFNNPEWFIANLGAIYGGGIPVGIYPTSTPEACQYIMSHSRCNIIFVENEVQLRKILEVKSELPYLKRIVQYIGEPYSPDAISWKEFMAFGKEEGLQDKVDVALSKIAANKCCQIVYTSGTTGKPKGVMLSHDNITFTSRLAGETFNLKEKEERFVSYLPLSHVAAAVVDIYIAITFRVTVTFADKNALKGTLTDTLRECRPTLFFGVPRVFEKIQEKMMETAKGATGLKKVVGKWAKETGFHYNKNLIEHPNQRNNIQYKIADKLVFQKVKNILGLDKCVHFISGGAPMSLSTLEYFMSLDILIMQLFGMSETSGPITSNVMNARKLSSVGRPLKGLSLRISKDGEICTLGRNVMMGYLNDPKSMEESFTEDGWLKSGDLGKMDSNGFLTITGRQKELIITAGGENIPPILIEDKLKDILPIISYVIVIGDKKKYLSCFITLKVTLDPNTQEPSDNLSSESKEWCEKIGSKAQRVSEILDSPDDQVLSAIQDGISKYNKVAFSNAQKVQKWIILPKDFSVTSGELSPTLKMKRQLILTKYDAQVQKMYS